MQIKNELARELLLAIVILIGTLIVYWVNEILRIAYLLVSLVLLVWQRKVRDKKILIASRFWILVFPFIGVLNPSKLGWFLAFLVISWLASKNAFPKKERKEKH